ncbi:MAG: folate family ECF transporter S component [Clostridia bacterium]|nr:folate family ECF transporter S component [Clostridia bacterium]
MKKKNLRALIITAVFAALSIVLGKFAAINIGDTIRFSFENLPIMLTSFLLGPLWGGACGLVADVLGCILRGYAINPGITAAAVLMGVIPALMTRYILKKDGTVPVLISGFTSHVICSMLIKTVALHIVYLTPYGTLFATRVPTYAVIGLLESYICALLMKNKTIRRELMK